MGKSIKAVSLFLSCLVITLSAYLFSGCVRRSSTIATKSQAIDYLQGDWVRKGDGAHRTTFSKKGNEYYFEVDYGDHRDGKLHLRYSDKPIEFLEYKSSEKNLIFKYYSEIDGHYHKCKIDILGTDEIRIWKTYEFASIPHVKLQPDIYIRTNSSKN